MKKSVKISIKYSLLINYLVQYWSKSWSKNKSKMRHLLFSLYFFTPRGMNVKKQFLFLRSNFDHTDCSFKYGWLFIYVFNFIVLALRFRFTNRICF